MTTSPTLELAPQENPPARFSPGGLPANAQVNGNHLKLRAGRLFPEIARLATIFSEANPEAAEHRSRVTGSALTVMPRGLMSDAAGGETKPHGCKSCNLVPNLKKIHGDPPRNAQMGAGKALNRPPGDLLLGLRQCGNSTLAPPTPAHRSRRRSRPVAGAWPAAPGL